MRLPTKTEVEKEKILERQQDVREGLAIAKKVDAVRMELLKEQNNLNKFRTETTVIVQNEIDNLLRQRASLTYENEVLDRTNKLLKEPFDKEWEELHQKRMQELNDNADRIEKTRIAIESEKAQIALFSAQKEKEANEARLALEEAKRERLEAKNELHDADQRLENAKIAVAEHQSRIDAENNQLATKNEQLALTLRDIQVREAAIQKSAAQLAKRERFINSKYKALMNAQEQLQK